MPKDVYLDPDYQRKYRAQEEHKAPQKRYKETYDLRLKTHIAKELGNCCVKCGSKERLELDHKNPAEYVSRARRGFNTSMKIFEATKDNLQVLCHECHKKRSAAQRKASWELFISLPLDEQERLMSKYLQ